MSASTSPKDEQDQEWIARIRAGDPRAFEALFSAHYEPLVRFAYGLLQSRAAAEEVVQEIFLKLWEQRARWEVQRTLRTYLYGATRNGALNALRHADIEQRLAARMDTHSDTASAGVMPRMVGADERVRVQELRAAIARAIERLPARCRETFVLSREHQMTYEQIADVMGVSVRTVEEQIGRAIKSLRTSLSPWLE